MEELSKILSDHPRMTYDVFLSFRGEDTRNTFTGFLYEALHQLGIITFMDDKKLEIGDQLSERLLKAIEESRSSIVILSEDYASSKWCLRELAKIIDCMGTTHRVLPVFYHVDPSHVRNQSGTFRKGFDEHQVTPEDFTDKQKEVHLKEIQNWRDSMRKIGNLSGLVVTKHSPEVDIVMKITSQIFSTWRPKLVASDENLVGMTAPLQYMNVQLGVGLEDVRFVGIVGMGGIGKTTIAKVVYDCITPEFEGSCFLCISKQSTVVSLQEQLLSRLQLKEDIRIWDEGSGVDLIKKQLSGRKVFLVLDGASKKGQLEMLAGSPDWFGPGSRVIITTRNKDLLHEVYDDKIVEYNVELLDHENAQLLFCKKAFRADDKNFVDLRDKIIKMVNRLPLALKVIGSYLYKKNKMIWEETSGRLLKIDEENFFDILKISYDGLSVESQNVFLDLACFFNGNREDRVIQMLESFQYSPHSQIQLLTDRCLIEVSDRKILMHDLIQEMGQEIVRGEFLTEPGKQSRIWLRKDVNRIFSVKDGLKYTQGIVLNLEEQEELRLKAKSFTYMNSLRILQISNVQFSEDIQYLSNILGFLSWPGFPSKCLPTHFQSRYLFELHLPRSSIRRLWEGTKEFAELKVIDVSDSMDLLETPDFSGVPKLERLDLRNCKKLCRIHPSINCLDYLVFLNLLDCQSFRSFSSYIRCKSLETLILSRSGLVSFPKIEKVMESLTNLYLNETFIEEIHSSVEHLTGLVLLNLENCTMLSNLPKEIGNLRSLKTLLLNGCKNLNQVPPSLGNVESLEHLDISKTSISQLPSTIHYLKNLNVLNCEMLSPSVWHSLLPPFSIPRSCSKVSGLKLFSYSFGLISLRHLSVRGCNLEDEDIPNDLHYFSLLHFLDLSDNHFVQLPKSICHLQNLKELRLNDCFKLQEIPKLPEDVIVMTSISKSTSVLKNLPVRLPHFKNFNHVPKNFSTDQRSYEVHISQGIQFYAMLNGPVEEFELFDMKGGNQIEIQYDRDDRSNIYGVALLAYIQYLQNTTQYSCYIVLVLDPEVDPWYTAIPVLCRFSSTNRALMLFIPFRKFPKMLSTQNFLSFKATIWCPEQVVEVKKCGARVLSRQSAPKFLAKMFTKIFGDQKELYWVVRGCDYKGESSCNELENAEEYCSSLTTESIESADSSESDSILLLKRNLKSILQRTLEEPKRTSPFYFFPLGEISRWFIMQKQDTVRLKLPLHVLKKKKWMGIALIAVFSLHENFERIKSPLQYSFKSHMELTVDNPLPETKGYSCITPFFVIPLHLLDGSHQILFVRFIPGDHFPYEVYKLDNLCISFITNAATLRVELCGARLVYQQNVEELTDTIVDCALKSGEDLYEHYNRNAWGQLMFTFQQPRHHIQNTSVEEVPVGQPTTPTSCDSVNELLHESFSPSLFKKSIKEQYGSNRLDVILHENKIPEFFTCQSMGNEGTVRLPKKWNCVGFLGCALVIVKEQMETIPKPESCVRVLDLICQFGIDSYEVKPMHHHFFPQEKLLSQCAPQFVWVFYTPRAAFDVLWYYYNEFKIKLRTDNEELFQVQQCGLHLVRKTELKTVHNLLNNMLRCQVP